MDWEATAGSPMTRRRFGRMALVALGVASAGGASSVLAACSSDDSDDTAGGGLPAGSPGMSGSKAGPFEIVSFKTGRVRRYMSV
jgi:hypothetical protein